MSIEIKHLISPKFTPRADATVVLASTAPVSRSTAMGVEFELKTGVRLRLSTAVGLD